MERLTKRYKNTNKLAYVRASRVDYYTQHSVQEWIDHLGSLGAHLLTHSLTHMNLFITLFFLRSGAADYGKGNSIFINLAGVSGPVSNRPDAMMDVNYRATIASAEGYNTHLFIEICFIIHSFTHSSKLVQNSISLITFKEAVKR